MPKRKGSGRKPAKVSCLFKDIQNTGKVPRIKCTFCGKELTKNDSRMKNHVKICIKCPNSVKQKYVKTDKDSELSIFSTDDSIDYVTDASTSNMTTAESVALMCDGCSNLRNDSIINFIVTVPSPLLYKILVTEKESRTVVTIIKNIKQSHVFLAIFKEKQKDTKISLKLPVETRWGSIISCSLESVQINKHAIQSLAIDENLQDIIEKHPIFKKNALNECFWDKTEAIELIFNSVKKILDLDKNNVLAIWPTFKPKKTFSANSFFGKLLIEFHQQRGGMVCAKAQSFQK
ncbi:PREDICTED: uncharacterized protein LOC105456953 [Wasmannia auropunctata]|uniref:uncharacterized protein LOC105456953 n=1 Tax=Wasmannia auropunctata TaxID=64793 RepID=UPI0005EED505|nr:PREDICTED: uncharacterized protein LOC105456953 [Wasmannia auropunctata]